MTEHDRLFDELGRPLPAPDLTNLVMSRIGRTGPGSRKRRWLRIGAPLGICAIAVGFTVIGVRLYQQTVPRRVPSRPTIPSAVQQDLRLHGDTIDRALRTIRNLNPRLPEPTVTPQPTETPQPVSPEA